MSEIIPKGRVITVTSTVLVPATATAEQVDEWVNHEGGQQGGIARAMQREHERRKEELVEAQRRAESRAQFFERHGTTDVMAFMRREAEKAQGGEEDDAG